MDYAEKMQRCHEYIEALEEERRKIQVFQRELPLCLELVSQAIDTCKQQLSGGTTAEFFPGQSECSEQTSSEGPVLEEFIPMKRTSNDNDEQESHKSNNNEKSGKKLDWLRSVQLWNQTPDPPHKEDPPRKASVVDVKKNGGAFKPFNKDEKKGVLVSSRPTSTGKSPSSVPTAATSSTAETVTGGSDGNRREEVDGQSNRKQRRCWSPELHRRFLHALQQLGGSHVATPKQIRELMKVDGLTNDEVKSHLQKYRLHTRRPSPAIHNNTNPEAPQFVVVGGIWMQPPEYAAVAAKTELGEATGIYAPIAAPPPSETQRQQQKQLKKQSQSQSESEERGSHSGGGGVHSNSPATSSSTHTTTASPQF